MGYIASPRHQPCYNTHMPGKHQRKQEQAEERGFYRLSVRMPVEVQAELERISEDEGRSLNAQIVWCMRAYIEQKRTKDKPS